MSPGLVSTNVSLLRAYQSSAPVAALYATVWYWPVTNTTEPSGDTAIAALGPAVRLRLAAHRIAPVAAL
jgi:hypothetical protein